MIPVIAVGLGVCGGVAGTDIVNIFHVHTDGIIQELVDLRARNHGMEK